jgi:hypothetical protein
LGAAFQALHPPTLNSCTPGGRQIVVLQMSPSAQLRRTPLLVSQHPRASVWPTTAMRSPNPTRLWGTTISTDVVTGLSTAALQTAVATACGTEQSESTCFSEVPLPASSKQAEQKATHRKSSSSAPEADLPTLADEYYNKVALRCCNCHAWTRERRSSPAVARAARHAA